MRVLYLSVFSLLFISSCATRQPQVADPELHWQKHQASVASLPSWRASGRVAVKTEQDGWTASFSWRQTGDDYTIRLHGPLGRGMVELVGNSQRVQLKQSGQPVQVASSAEDLLFQATGWLFPVSGLRYWLLGVPVQGQKEQHSLNTDGSLQRLEQAGWQTDYTQYQQIDALNLPVKLRLTNDKIQVKLIVKDWQMSD
jgi:outer membrane lipoprotein LolB